MRGSTAFRTNPLVLRIFGAPSSDICSPMPGFSTLYRQEKVYVLHPYSRIGTTTGLYIVQSVLRSKPDGVASQILYSWPLTLSSRSWCKRLKFNLRLWKKFLPDNSSCSPLYSVSVDRALFFPLALTMTLLLSLLIFISYAYELFHSNDW